jgi:hypothetical protein
VGDAGLFSAANVEHCRETPIEPLLARQRDQDYLPWYECWGEPPPLPDTADATERMLPRL